MLYIYLTFCHSCSNIVKEISTLKYELARKMTKNIFENIVLLRMAY